MHIKSSHEISECGNFMAFCFGRAVSDVQLKVLIRVSEFTSGDVDAVELAQLNKCTQIIA